MISNNIIKINEGAEIVNINESKFNNIELSGTGKGAAINAAISGNCSMIIKSSTFQKCKALNGGAIYVTISSMK
jgi:hypothetical protein